MNIRFVQQTTDDNCVLACVAMVAGLSIESIINIAKTLKIKIPVDVFGEYKLLAYTQCMYIPSLHASLYGNKTYLITVPSLNFEGINHRIVVQMNETDYENVFDPQSGRIVHGVHKKEYTKHNIKGFTDALEVERL